MKPPTIRTLSVRQPYASLLMLGAERGGKSIETRSWDTHYRGTIAIHAAKIMRKPEHELCGRPATRKALALLGYRDWTELPLGCVLGTASLVRTFPLDGSLPPEPERFFGNFTAGRFGFEIVEPHILLEPIPATGALGFWEWTPPYAALTYRALDDDAPQAE